MAPGRAVFAFSCDVAAPSKKRRHGRDRQLSGFDRDVTNRQVCFGIYRRSTVLKLPRLGRTIAFVSNGIRITFGRASAIASNASHSLSFPLNRSRLRPPNPGNAFHEGVSPRCVPRSFATC